MASSARSRPSNPSGRGPTPLPPYQPPQHPLNESAQRALQNLPRDHKLDSLKNKLRAANSHLTYAAADVNERLQMKNVQYEKHKKRLEKQGSQEDDEQATIIVDERQKADEMTGRLEENVRKIIDSGVEVENVERALRELQENVTEGRGRFLPTQSTLGASQLRRLRQGANADDEENEFADDTSQPIGENDSAVGVLKRKIADQHTTYEAMSMTKRYAVD